MKRYIKIVIFLFTLFNSLSTNAQFVWVKSFGSNQPEEGTSITVDIFGNIYTVGIFTFTVDFDPGVGVFNLTSAGGRDIYILKLDAAGNFLWAKNLGGTGNDMPLSITTDGTGNVYTTGFYLSTADFDPGAGVFNLIAVGGADIFISKLDASGNFVWAKTMGGTGATDQGKSIKVDASNNVYITGFFSTTVDFDPSAGTFNLASAGGNDIFIAKLDPSGNFLWANKIGGIGADQGNSIVLDASNNVYVTGFFNGANVDFDTGAGTALKTSAGSSDVFVLKLNTSGVFNWVSTIGGTVIDEANGINIDASGNIYTTGRFFGTSDFDPGAANFNISSTGSSDIFVSKLNNTGDFVWAKTMGGPRADVGLSISLDASSNVYTMGNFQTFSAEVADFDPNAGAFNLASIAATSDMFMSSLDASGNFRCAGAIGGASTDNGASIVADATGNIFMTGKFNSTVDFDPFAGTFNLVGSNEDPFILKLSGCSVVLPITLINFNAICRESHILLTWQTITEINNNFFTLERSADAKNWIEIATIEGAGNSNSIENYSFNDYFFSDKTVYYRLKQTDFNGDFEYFNVAVANCLTNSATKVTIFPNPTNRFLNVEFNIDEQINYNLTITDLLGKMVFVENVANLKKGKNTINFDLNIVPKGIYLIKIELGNGYQMVEKIIKQ